MLDLARQALEAGVVAFVTVIAKAAAAACVEAVKNAAGAEGRHARPRARSKRGGAQARSSLEGLGVGRSTGAIDGALWNRD